MSFLDTQQQMGGALASVDDVSKELSNRYLILTYNFLHLLKTRLADFIVFREARSFSCASGEVDPTYALDLMHMWHRVENEGLRNRLEGICMIPYFFSPVPPGYRPVDLEVSRFLKTVRQITNEKDQIHKGLAASRDNGLWNEGGPNRLLIDFVYGHVESLAKGTGHREPSCSTDPLSSSYLGIATTVGLYLHSILDISNRAEPIETPLLRHVLLVVQRDLDQSTQEMRDNTSSKRRALWLWKAFTATLTLAKNRHITQTRRGGAHHDVLGSAKRDLLALQYGMKARLRLWSGTTGVTEWARAKTILLQIVWPTAMPAQEEIFAQNTWEGIF
jgi:hypothetical protein